MKAMIFAAGLGTRLRPVTDNLPKALVVVNGRTLLETAIIHLRENYVSSILVNVHHHAGQVVGFLADNNNFGMDIAVSDESTELLDTGGGLNKAAWFFKGNDPFIARNVDIISDLDLKKVVRHHQKTEALATLVVRKRETARYLLFDGNGQLCGRENRKTGEKIITRDQKDPLTALAFSGIHVISPGIFSLITEQGKFSITDLYVRLSAARKIVAFLDDISSWKDVGRLEDLIK